LEFSDLSLVDLFIAKALPIVILNHADSLHESVTDGWTDKLETPPQQIFTQRLRLSRL
jgi:hypothetical protein